MQKTRCWRALCTGIIFHGYIISDCQPLSVELERWVMFSESLWALCGVSAEAGRVVLSVLGWEHLPLMTQPPQCEYQSRMTSFPFVSFQSGFLKSALSFFARMSTVPNPRNSRWWVLAPSHFVDKKTWVWRTCDLHNVMKPGLGRSLLIFLLFFRCVSSWIKDQVRVSVVTQAAIYCRGLLHDLNPETLCSLGADLCLCWSFCFPVVSSLRIAFQ